MRSPLFRSLFFLVLAGCQSPSGRWSPADAAAPNRMRCCTGRVARVEVTADGGRELRMVPRADCVDLLAAGQSELICYLPASRLTLFAEVLDRVGVGAECEVCGWFVRDNTTNLHQLRPLTSIDPYLAR